jgi:hypothetical protein
MGELYDLRGENRNIDEELEDLEEIDITDIKVWFEVSKDKIKIDKDNIIVHVEDLHFTSNRNPITVFKKIGFNLKNIRDTGNSKYIIFGREEVPVDLYDSEIV